MDAILAIAVFLTVFPVILRWLSHRSEASTGKNMVAKRLGLRRDESDPENVSITRKAAREEGEILSGIIGTSLLHRMQQWIRQANANLNATEVFLLCGIGLLAGIMGGQLIFDDRLMAFSFGAALGAAPLLYVKFRRQRRLKQINEQLPHVLDLIKSSLEAGHSFQRALQVVVNEFDDPISGEMRIVLEQSRIGLPIPRALDDMLERVPDEDLELLSLAVKVQSDVGSSLAQIVGRLSEIVRLRQRLHLQVHAMTSQSRLSGMIVGLLPVAVLGIFSLIRPGYMADLLSDPAGVMLLKVAMGLDAMALVAIRMLLKVEY
jgi:tight adherence protein B